MDNELIKPLGHMAAEELLADLRAQPALRGFVLPDVWLGQDQISAIDALSHASGICVAVGLGEDRLPHAGDDKQGGIVGLGLAAYVFRPADGVPEYDARLLESVWLTVVHYAMRFRYLPPGGQQPIPAILRDIATVGLDTLQQFAPGSSLEAQALLMEIPVRI